MRPVAGVFVHADRIVLDRRPADEALALGQTTLRVSWATSGPFDAGEGMQDFHRMGRGVVGRVADAV